MHEMNQSTKVFFYICCSCELSIHQRNQQISILEWFLKDRDTEDWSNDAENVALNYMNKLHFIIYSNSKLSLNCSNIFFFKINAVSVSSLRLLSKTIKNPYYKILNCSIPDIP